jgi:hypothetical protein
MHPCNVSLRILSSVCLSVYIYIIYIQCVCVLVCMCTCIRTAFASSGLIYAVVSSLMHVALPFHFTGTRTGSSCDSRRSARQLGAVNCTHAMICSVLVIEKRCIGYDQVSVGAWCTNCDQYRTIPRMVTRLFGHQKKTRSLFVAFLREQS